MFNRLFRRPKEQSSQKPTTAVALVELQAILQVLYQPAQLDDMSHRIELCRRALQLVDRGGNALRWAALQFTLANFLAQNPQGNRADNIEQAIDAYQQALTVRTQAGTPVDWAETMNNLANAYVDRIHGERAENLEQAIDCYQQALTVFTRTATPVEWGTTMMSLASTYTDRIRGERADNIEQAIAAFRESLAVRTQAARPVEWAQTMMNLGTAYSSRVQGARADNIEQAIDLYQQALKVYTRADFPSEWAQTQNNLANAFANRVRGNRAANMEQAINHAQNALQIYTQAEFPEDWARAQNNLAATFANRIHGSSANNIEQAINHAQNALQVYTRVRFPEDWARSQSNLALAYTNRIHGSRADNIEQAINGYQQALTILTQAVRPVEWAQTMMNLGTAYSNRVQGERADNIEQAIDLYQQALKVYTRADFPTDRAMVQNNLANAFTNRVHGNRAANMEQAIDLYQQALQIYDQAEFPEDWAMTQNNLATAFTNRILGSSADNIEQAINHYQQALQVRTPTTFPLHWAETQNNLATAYAKRLLGDQADNIEQAIDLYQQALQIYDQAEFPEYWAMTQHNLADAYRSRLLGSRTDNIEQAINLYRLALQIYTSEQFPADYRWTQRSLGNLHFNEHLWAEAEAAYRAAIEIGQLLLNMAYTESGRRAEVSATAQLYARSAYCELRLNQQSKALLTLEQGKTRLLAENLALVGANLSRLPDAQQQAINTAREAIRNLEAEMRLSSEGPRRQNIRDLAQALQQARSDLTQLITAIRQEHPDFMPIGLDLPELLALIPPSGALVAPLITSQGSAVFVIPHGVETVGMDHVIWLDDFKDNNLQTLLVGTEDQPGWLRVYLNRHLNSTVWFEMIETTGQNLWSQLVGPICNKLKAFDVAPSASLLLFPQGGLGLLPLHAAWREVDGAKRTLLDDYTITYAPSGYGLNTSRRRLQEEQRQRRSLLAVVNPTQDLTYAPIEGEAVVALFDAQATKSLIGQAATPEAVQREVVGCSYLHFSCHGFYNWLDAMQSGLVLAQRQPLTLADIIGKLNMGAARLVTMSACETGLTEFRQSPDEYLGLPAGFLQAGAPGVISTLWAVDDLSTMLLMEKFYQLHLRDGLEIALALRQAQLWLRDVTAGELSERFSVERQAAISTIRMPVEVVTREYRRFAVMSPDDCPFAHPFYWAAFVFNGA